MKNKSMKKITTLLVIGAFFSLGFAGLTIIPFTTTAVVHVDVQTILSSINSSVVGGSNPYALSQNHTTAFCASGAVLLAGAGTGPSCDNSSSPACGRFMNYEYNGMALNGQQGWTSLYSTQDNAIYDTVRTEAVCLPTTTTTALYFSIYNRSVGGSNFYSLNQSNNIAYCDAGDFAISGGGFNVYCDSAPADRGCGVQMLEFNGRVVSGNREGWRVDYSMNGDNFYDTIKTTVVCLKKTSAFDQNFRLYNNVNTSGDLYSRNQNKTTALCSAGDIAIGGSGNPSYCDGVNSADCATRVQYLESNKKIITGNQQGWYVAYNLGGDTIYDTQRTEVTCLGPAATVNNTLVVSCSASPNPANINQSVSFNTSVSGGTGSYAYTWSGQCSGSNQNCSNSFSSAGTYNASLSVTSGSQTQTASCSVVVSAVTAPQCSDGLDNDGDNATDFAGGDFSCSSATDNDETNPRSACQDGLDNDSDNLFDFPQDPGCINKQDNSESNISTLVVSCSASPNPANINQSVSFNTSVSGGTGSYAYTWSGQCSGSNQNCSNSFSSAGTYNASLSVTSGSQTQTASCSVVVSAVTAPQCSDGLDNDIDGATDFAGGDFSCSSATDNDETNPKSACQDGLDNDSDGLFDLSDPGCLNKQDNSESNISTLVVSCSASPNPANINQSVSFGALFSGGTGSYAFTWSGQCSGSNQNCSNSFSSAGTYNASLSVTSGTQTQGATCSVVVSAAPVATFQCSDGLDNDVDGATDFAGGDFSCSSATDNDETNPKSACQDGLDNDSDGLFDLSDPGCLNKQDNSESNISTLVVSCSASPNPANINQSVSFGALFSGGTGSYAFTWSGQCSGSNQNCSNSFSTAGTYTSTVSVTSGSQTQTASCSVVVNTQGSIACNSVSGCPGSGFTGNSTCQGNNIYRNYTQYTCINPGTTSSFCSSSTASQFQFTCSNNQTCSLGSCVNQNSNNIFVTTLIRNLSSGNLNWVTSVGASPSDILQYQITLQNSSGQNINNVTVRDVLPVNLLYFGNLMIDGISNSGNIISGISIGNLSAGQTRIINYQVQVAGPQNFSFGTTTLNNTVTVSSTDSGFNPSTTFASAVVNRGGVLGATSVSTGLTNNPWLDSFFLPLILALLGVWAWKSGLLNTFGIAQFVGGIKAKNSELKAQNKLAEKIAEIRNRENS